MQKARVRNHSLVLADLVSQPNPVLTMGAAASISDARGDALTTATNRPIKFDVGDPLTVFAEEMIARSPKVDGLTDVMSSAHGRDAFTQFLRTE